MVAALQVLVGGIIVAIGLNLFTKAAEDAAAEREWLQKLWWPRSAETARTWSNRLCGGLLVVFGLAIAIDAFV